MKMIVMSCSATKRSDEADLRAIDRYDGPMWKTLRARLAELPRAQAALESGELSIVVLSAQFGFMNWADMIPNYERLMTKARADEVATWGSCEPFKVRDGVHDCEAILFAGGELYRSAMWKASKSTAADRAKISETDGAGVGHHRAELSAWLEEHFGEAVEGASAGDDPAFLCGYQDELSGAPSTAAPRIHTTGEAFARYQAGRNAALAEVVGGDGWIAWDQGPMPVEPFRKVQVRMADGWVDKPGGRAAELWSWNKRVQHPATTIVAYREVRA